MMRMSLCGFGTLMKMMHLLSAFKIPQPHFGLSGTFDYSCSDHNLLESLSDISFLLTWN